MDIDIANSMLDNLINGLSSGVYIVAIAYGLQ